MEQEERNDDIEYWWGGAESAVELPQSEYIRLRQAFFQVLASLPEEDLEQFFRESPNIICSAFPGRVFSYSIAIPPNTPADHSLRLNGIYLEPKITERENFLDMVAHEIAHIVRGDHRIHIDPNAEEKADDLSESWGFRRCYSEQMLEQLRSRRAIHSDRIRRNPRTE